MNTSAIHVNSELYRHANEYAKQHNTSIEKMMEGYIISLLSRSQKKEPRPLSPIIEKLGKMNLAEFTDKELKDDPRLAHLLEREED